MKMLGKTEGRKDGRTLFYKTFLATVGGSNNLNKTYYKISKI